MKNYTGDSWEQGDEVDLAGFHSFLIQCPSVELHDLPPKKPWWWKSLGDENEDHKSDHVYFADFHFLKLCENYLDFDVVMNMMKITTIIIDDEDDDKNDVDDDAGQEWDKVNLAGFHFNLVAAAVAGAPKQPKRVM